MTMIVMIIADDKMVFSLHNKRKKS